MTRIALALTALLAATAAIAERVSLVKTQFVTGPSLLALLLFLAAYGARRRVSGSAASALTAVSAAGWLRAHLTAGVMSVILFVAHAGINRPTGRLEGTLAAVYSVVTLSGVLGLWVNRRLVRRLSTDAEEGSGNIPSMRRRLSERLASVVQTSVAETGSTALADFHETRLKRFFAGPRHLWPHLVDSRGPRQRLLGELALVTHKLGDRERELGNEIASLVRMKDDLDNQSAVQLALRGWLFVHVPLTYILLLLAVLHGVVARAFWGGGG